MKKISTWIIILLLSVAIFWLGFDYKTSIKPKTYYQVYLDDQVLGVIKSKEKLYDYINNKGNYYKKELGVDTVYPPNGLEVKKITTYDKKVDKVNDVYNRIDKLKPFTIEGYQLTINKEDENEIIYITDPKIFENAVKNTITAFIGENNYKLYLNEEQKKIETVGNIIDNVYVEEDLTLKKTKISVEETIYIDEDELSQYLLFGTNEKNQTYTVKLGDTIDRIAFTNKINVEEFFISNPEFNSIDNLLFPGQEVYVGIIDPVLSIVVEETKVEDVERKYRTEYRKDASRVIGEDEIVQEGVSGLDRVTTLVKSVNGNVVIVEPDTTIEIKPSVTEVVLVGTRYQPSVGSLYSWGWPTQGGWMITSYYQYRSNPFTGRRELHAAIDIAGPGYGSNIYAANNGTIYKAQWHNSLGYYIIINHNNGYYSLYSHLSSIRKGKIGSVVGRGEVIGSMGMTGDATGPHLHYEIWVGVPFNGGYQTNPLNYY
ncbi:MAG: M23 family metallopeptidase [Bacilli bacterium]|nr:M23 family metallopeptidase [Bacilli bacterium]MDD4808637.1 M23 family metallopeptidase [Bacilli bacterium]